MPDPRETHAELGNKVSDLVIASERLDALPESAVKGSVVPPPDMAAYEMTGPELAAAIEADLSAKKATLKAEALAIIDTLTAEIEAL